jgi:hypothetical protein
MDDPPAKPDPEDRLDSWKEIAAFLGRDVRTVQRWEALEGLPVHRHHHAERGSVYAFRHEVKAWRAARTASAVAPRSARAAVSRRALTLVALFALGGAALGAKSLLRRSSPLPPPPAVADHPSRLFARATREGGGPARVPLGGHPGEVALSPDGSVAYVCLPSRASVAFVDVAAARVLRTAPVAEHPVSLAVSPDGRRLWVGTSNGKVAVLDTADGRVEGVAEVGGRVRALAVSPDGAWVYLALEYSGLKRLHAQSLRAEAMQLVGCPVDVALDPPGARLYVAYQCQGPGGRPGHDAIDVIDVPEGRLADRFQGPPHVGGSLAVSPEGTTLWAVGHDACMSPAYDHVGCPEVPSFVISAYRLADRSLLRTVSVPLEVDPGRVGFFPGGRRVFSTGAISQVFNPQSFAAVEAYSDENLGRLVIDRPGRRAVAGVYAAQALAVFDLWPVACEPSAEGLVHHWAGDGTPADSVDGAHGTLQGGASFARGRVGMAFRFDGKTAAVDLGDRETVHLWEQDATFAAWVRFDSVEGEMRIVDRLVEKPEPAGWRVAKLADGRFAFCLAGPSGASCRPGSPSAVVGSTVAVAERWYHLAAVCEQSRAALYVDGRREAEAGIGPLREVQPAPERRLGAGIDGAHLHGLVDEVVLYGRALDADEIRRLYELPTRPECGGRR